MEKPLDYKFPKAEKLCSKLLIEALFAGGNKSISRFPIRIVAMPVERKDTGAAVQVLISVSKRRFKHAVKRNKVKRQLREAYRLNKHLLQPFIENNKHHMLVIAFLWLSDKIYPTNEVQACVARLLTSLNEQLNIKNKNESDEKA